MAATQRQLLFGLIALQVGLIDQERLLAAFRAWTCDKARPLEDHLADLGGLDADGRTAIEAMVAVHLKKHAGDTEKSLASIPALPAAQSGWQRSVIPSWIARSCTCPRARPSLTRT